MILRNIARGLILLAVIYKVSSQCSTTNLNAVETLGVNQTIQTFDTPGYRVAYYANVACSWIFDAGRDDATIVFEIQELLMENSRKCAFDSISFYEGNSTSDTVIKKACGRLYAGASGSYLTSSGRYAMIKMKSDRSRQYAGARITYFYAVENSAGSCSGSTASITATLDSDYITSPGFPISLDKSLDCTWTITCQAGAILRLDIFYSDMNSVEGMCFDQILAIYDGSSSSDPALLESWCDSSIAFPSQPTVYYTTDNTAYVTLATTSEATVSKHGFRLNFRQNSSAITTTQTPLTTTTTSLVQRCSESATLLEATDTWKYFQTLNYPNYYPNGALCQWRIMAPQGYTLNLTFVDVSMQSGGEVCNRDVVNVFDGQSGEYPRLESFCGESMPVIQSTGRYLYVLFRSDYAINFRGFSAQYKYTPGDELPVCTITDTYENLTATEVAQNFTSPNYPNNYNDSMTVYWMIHNPNETQAVTLRVLESTIEASDGCIYDYVKVYKGPCTSYPKSGTFCGYSTPKYYNKGTYTLVKFTTDDNTNYKGFVIEYYLTDIEEEDSNFLIITGIVVGSVLGAVALIALVTFGAYKYVKYRNKHNSVSHNSSRRSSDSSDSSSSSLYRSPKRLQLSDLLKPPPNLYKK